VTIERVGLAEVPMRGVPRAGFEIRPEAIDDAMLGLPAEK